MNKRMILGLLGLAFIAGLGVADDLVPVAVSPGAENGKSVPRRVLHNIVSGLAAVAKESFNLAGDPLSQQLIDVEAEEGTSNTFYGLDAGNESMTGASNSFFGRYAGDSNTSGDNNTFMGRAAGRLNKTGYENTFLGSQAGNHNTNGYANVFVGASAGSSNTEGDRNVFVGGFSGEANTNGFNNAFIGYSAGNNNTSGDRNTFVGNRAGGLNELGYNNTFLGESAGHDNITGHGNVFLGSGAGEYSTGSNKLMIDNEPDASPLIYGKFDTEFLNFNAKLRINQSATITMPTHLLDVGTSGAYCDGGAWVDGSSREYKENIEELTSADALQAFEALEPVKFNYKENKDETYLGFIAEDVPDLVAMNDRKGLNAMDMVAMLTKVVQEQQKSIAELRAEVARLKAAEKEN